MAWKLKSGFIKWAQSCPGPRNPISTKMTMQTLNFKEKENITKPRATRRETAVLNTTKGDAGEFLCFTLYYTTEVRSLGARTTGLNALVRFVTHETSQRAGGIISCVVVLFPRGAASRAHCEEAGGSTAGCCTLSSVTVTTLSSNAAGKADARSLGQRSSFNGLQALSLKVHSESRCSSGKHRGGGFQRFVSLLGRLWLRGWWFDPHTRHSVLGQETEGQASS